MTFAQFRKLVLDLHTHLCIIIAEDVIEARQGRGFEAMAEETYTPAFVEQALAKGPTTEHMSQVETRDGVTIREDWSLTTHVIATPYRGWWILECEAPDSPSAWERHSFHAYRVGDIARQRLESHLYATDVPTLDLTAMQAHLDAIMASEVVEQAVPAPVATHVEPVQPDSEWIECPNCGAPTRPELLMSARLGTACPACYDDLSS